MVFILVLGTGWDGPKIYSGTIYGGWVDDQHHWTWGSHGNIVDNLFLLGPQLVPEHIVMTAEEKADLLAR